MKAKQRNRQSSALPTRKSRRVSGWVWVGLASLLIPTASTSGQDAPVGVTLTETARANLAAQPPGKRPDHIVTSLAYSADGQSLAVGLHTPFTILLLEAATLAVRGQFEGHLGLVSRVAFTPDGKTLVSAGHDGTVRVWDIATRRERLLIDQFQGNVRGLALSPDGTTVYTGEMIPGLKGTAQAWDLATGRLLGAPANYDHGIEDLTVSPDGRTLATTSRDQTIRLWDLPMFTPQASFDAQGPFASDLAFNTDGTSLAAVYDDKTLRLFDLPTLRPRYQIKTDAPSFLQLAIAPDGSTLATTDSNRLRLWRLADGSPLASMPEIGEHIFAIQFSPDGRSVVVGGMPRLLRVYRVAPAGK